VGIPVLYGREIGLQDSGNTPRVGVVNQAFVQSFFPNTNPIGKHVTDTYPGNPGVAEIVGVVADAKYNTLREKTQPRLYAPFFNPLWEHSFAVYEMGAALRQAVQEVNASVLPIEIHTMSGLVDESLQSDRFIKQLASAFSLLALLLAAIGLYGLMAYTVSRRTRDIGIRLALGAGQGNVLWQVLRETLVLVLVGIIIGVPCALGGTRLMRSMLFGLGSADPVAILLAASVLTVVAAVAGFLPAWRASQVDPMVALRYE
jgi:ABC-type antimicrobial peptide transport system permease subunit